MALDDKEWKRKVLAGEALLITGDMNDPEVLEVHRELQRRIAANEALTRKLRGEEETK